MRRAICTRRSPSPVRAGQAVLRDQANRDLIAGIPQCHKLTISSRYRALGLRSANYAPPILDEAVYFPRSLRLRDPGSPCGTRRWRSRALCPPFPRFHDLMQAQAPFPRMTIAIGASSFSGHMASISSQTLRDARRRGAHCQMPVGSVGVVFVPGTGQAHSRHRGPFRGVVRCHIGLSMHEIPMAGPARYSGSMMWNIAGRWRFLVWMIPIRTKC